MLSKLNSRKSCHFLNQLIN